MPTASNGDVSLYYAIGTTGGAGDAETIAGEDAVVFVSEAGLGGWLWGWQHAALAGPYETITWDLRGTGRSDAPPGPFALATLADDLEAVCRASGVRRAHLVGVGLGGAVALEAARSSNRVASLALFGTAPRGSAFALDALFAPPDDPAALRTSLESALSPSFRTSQPDVLRGIADWRAEGDATRTGWAAQVAALEGFDATDWLVEVVQPTLVAHGTADELVSPAAGRELARGLPRGEFVALEGAGHLCVVERSRTVNDLLLGFLEDHVDA